MRKRAKDDGLDRTSTMCVIVIMSMAMPVAASARGGNAMGATIEYAILVGVLAVIVIVAILVIVAMPVVLTMHVILVLAMVMGVRLLAAAVVALAQTVNVLGALPRLRDCR